MIDSIINLPIPGQAKILSVITAKAIKTENCNPITVTIGINIYFNKWNVIILNLLKPFAFANLIKSKGRVS